MAGNYLHELKSRSQKKRESSEVTTLGARLLTLSAGELRALGLSDELLDAVAELRRLGGGKRGGTAYQRQLRFVGRLLRDVELSAIEARLGALEAAKKGDDEAFQRLEAWRDALVAGGEAAARTLTEISARFPGADTTALAETAHKAKAEMELGRPPKLSRQIFRYLRHLEQGLQDQLDD